MYPHLGQIVFLTHQNGEERESKMDIGTSAADSALPFVVARVYLIFFSQTRIILWQSLSCALFIFLCVPILVFNIRSKYFLQTGNTCACCFFCFSIFFCDAVSRPIYKLRCMRAHVYMYACVSVSMYTCVFRECFELFQGHAIPKVSTYALLQICL